MSKEDWLGFWDWPSRREDPSEVLHGEENASKDAPYDGRSCTVHHHFRIGIQNEQLRFTKILPAQELGIFLRQSCMATITAVFVFTR